MEWTHTSFPLLYLFISEAVNAVNSPVAIFPEVMAYDGRDMFSLPTVEDALRSFTISTDPLLNPGWSRHPAVDESGKMARCIGGGGFG